MTDPKQPAPSQNNVAPGIARLVMPDGSTFEFPIMKDTIGNWRHIDTDKGVLIGEDGKPVAKEDPRRAFAAAKTTFFSNGNATHSSAISGITYIDGDKGELYYRGYAIQDLAEKATYMEVCYLLLNGELPTKDQLVDFERAIVERMRLPEQLIKTLESNLRSAEPMEIMMSLTATLTAYLGKNIDSKTPEGRYEIALQTIAQSATIGALANRFTLNKSIVRPREDLGFTENYMRILFADADGNYKPNPVLITAMDRNLILHADHEQNASTSTVRLSGSSGTSPFASIAAGIGTLWGPSHGGANEAVLHMLKEIGTVDRIPAFIEGVKNGTAASRLMGFGHRVYKSYDPRAKVISEQAHSVLGQLNKKDPLLEVAMELERIALSDDYFKNKKLYPNVDFYSGIVLKAMGLLPQSFTTVFAVGRAVGWIAQWKEQADGNQTKIGRPRQVYIGSEPREFLAMQDRGPNGAEARGTLTAVEAPVRKPSVAG
jgi:citrate synthase